jgi:DNA-binding MarR family transcriptional regulator
LKKVWKEQPAQLESVMTGLDDAERRQLARLMNKMIATHTAPSYEES